MFGNNYILRRIVVVLAIFVAVLATNNVAAVELTKESELQQTTFSSTIQHHLDRFAKDIQGFTEESLEKLRVAASDKSLANVFDAFDTTGVAQARNHLSTYFGNIREWQKPLIAAVGISVVTYPAAPVVLGAMGFTASGVAAGSLAAAWQATLGNVAAGSAFATLTSCAMTPASVATVATTVSTVSGTVAGVATYLGTGWDTNEPEP